MITEKIENTNNKYRNMEKYTTDILEVCGRYIGKYILEKFVNVENKIISIN